MIVQEQSPQRVMDVRAKLYELLSHCIPPTVVLKVRLSVAFPTHLLHPRPPPSRAQFPSPFSHLPFLSAGLS